MKLNSITQLLVERTLDYHSNEYLQLVQVARMPKPAKEPEYERSFRDMIQSFDRMQKEVYEFWLTRLGSKNDLLKTRGSITVPSDYHGVFVPSAFISMNNHLNMVDIDVLKLLFPQKVVKLFMRGKELFTFMNDNTSVIRGPATTYSSIALATKIDRESFYDQFKMLDTWIHIVSRIEFYGQFAFGANDFLGSPAIRDEYSASELTKHVLDEFEELIRKKKQEMHLDELTNVADNDELSDYVLNLDKTVAAVDYMISKCMTLSQSGTILDRFVKLEYEIDPETKLVQKVKNKQGKMVPKVTFVREQPLGEKHLSNETPITSRSTFLRDRFSFEMYRSAPDFKDFEDDVATIRRSRDNIVNELLMPLLSRVWKYMSDSERELVSDMVDIEVFEEMSNIAPSRAMWGEVLRDLSYVNNIEKWLTTEHNGQPYSEQNLPKRMIEKFQEAERELVILAKLLRWL